MYTYVISRIFSALFVNIVKISILLVINISLHVFVVLLALHPESVLYGDLVGVSSRDPLLGVCLVY